MALSTEPYRHLAEALIEECGVLARMSAILRANRMRECGDALREELWLRVAAMILDLQDGTPQRH